MILNPFKDVHARTKSEGKSCVSLRAAARNLTQQKLVKFPSAEGQKATTLSDLA
jgi:hypothetical protein